VLQKALQRCYRRHVTPSSKEAKNLPLTQKIKMICKELQIAANRCKRGLKEYVSVSGSDGGSEDSPSNLSPPTWGVKIPSHRHKGRKH
jgi:hypothetical protein